MMEYEHFQSKQIEEDIPVCHISLRSTPSICSAPCQGNVAQGLTWGLMALGVYITFRLLDFADLTVDGSFATGGAVTVVLILNGWSTPAALLIAVLAGLASGLITGLLHTLLGIPPILAAFLPRSPCIPST